MKSSEKKILTLEIVSLIFLLFNLFLFKFDNIYVVFTFLLLLIIALNLITGFEKNRKRFKKDGIILSIIFTLSYLFIIYLSGLFLGFERNGYSLTFLNIVRNSFPILVVIIISEFLRFELNTKSENQKLLIILGTILFILVDINIAMQAYDFSNLNDLLEMAGLVILPSITKNILLTYFSLEFGFASTLIYRIIIEIYVYLVPILPDFNIYLESIITFVYPLILLKITKLMLKTDEEKEITVKKKNISKFVNVFVILIMLVIVLLTSGVFKYYFLSIGSGSMTPNINKGDVVIVEKLKENELEKIKKGDVLVYQKENQVIVHRVTEVNNDTFKTKGDNNDEEDVWVVNKKDIIGITKVRIPLLGYPTVWLNELLGGS